MAKNRASNGTLYDTPPRFAYSQAGGWPSGQGAGHYNQDVDTVVGSILMCVKVSRHLL